MSNLSEDGEHLGYLYRGVLPHEYDLVEFTQNFEPFGERQEIACLRLTSSGWSFEPGVASGRAGDR